MTGFRIKNVRCIDSSVRSAGVMRGNGRVICTMVLALLSRAADAGINGFHKWFGGKFGSAVTLTEPWQSDDFDHVCFDMNQVKTEKQSLFVLSVFIVLS